MRLSIFIVFLNLLFSSHSFSQPNDQLNYTDNKGLKQGYWRKKNEIGQLKYEGNFKDGKPIGHFIYYYPGGQKKAESDYYKNGTCTRTLLYHEIGGVKAKGNYLNEKKDSIWSFYDEKDRLTSIENYKDNKRNGKSVIYYPSGKKCEESEWENDIKNGLNIQYYENEKKKEEGILKQGKYEGKVTRYHDTGEKSAYGSYLNGAQVGDWFYYDERGFPTFKETVKKGERINFKYYNGTFDEEYPNGIPKLHISYKNSKKNGPFKEYYQKGEFKLVPKKSEDGSQEEVERILIGTQLKVEGNYVDDQYDGLIIFYTQDGKIEKKETYTKGVLLNKKK
jgi:antitoxin component YwqK of YwqJK toxin-antitoxin module